MTTIPERVRWLERVGKLIERHEALPAWIAERDDMIKWNDDLEEMYFGLQRDEAVSESTKQNIRMAEQAMEGWELNARAREEEQSGEQLKLKL